MAVADNITAAYDSVNDSWTYTFTVSTRTVTRLRVHRDPSMEFGYLANLGNNFGAKNPISLRTWRDPNSGLALRYLHWTKRSGTTETYRVWFSDNPNDHMNLTNHPGPLLYDPASHRNTKSALMRRTGGQEVFSVQETNSPITPEPGMLAMVLLGLGGVGVWLRRPARGGA